MIVIPEYSRCRGYSILLLAMFVVTMKMKIVKSMLALFHDNILQVFIKSKKTVDALSLLTEEEEKAVRCIFVHFGTPPP